MTTNMIYKKLNDARKLVRSGGYEKKGHNTYSQYDYFTPEQVEQIVADVCEKTKMMCLCNLKADAYGLYQELTLVDLEDDTIESLVFQLRTERGEMKATNTTQQMGGTDTYSERYIKMKVFQIKDNNLDFDSQDHTSNASQPLKTAPGSDLPTKTNYGTSNYNPATKKGKPASIKQKNFILSLAEQKGVELSQSDVDNMDSFQASQKIEELSVITSRVDDDTQYGAED